MSEDSELMDEGEGEMKLDRKEAEKRVKEKREKENEKKEKENGHKKEDDKNESEGGGKRKRGANVDGSVDEEKDSKSVKLDEEKRYDLR